MADLLDQLIPRLFPNFPFRCVPHEGKSDLERSLTRKLRSWREPGVRFVVMRDQNGGDCQEIKARLIALCQEDRRPDSLVRVVCRELEAWYMGDVDALTSTFPGAAKQIRMRMAKHRFRNPDDVAQPAMALAKLIPAFQKRSAARKMGALLSRQNHSHSYQAFLRGIDRLQAEGADGSGS